jgi:predicted DNA binding CopG/RHH family protein
VSIEDSVIEMRMQCKALSRAAKKAEKEGAVYQKKAKDALRKNDE